MRETMKNLIKNTITSIGIALTFSALQEWYLTSPMTVISV